MGLTDDQLTERYLQGEPLKALAEQAEQSLNALNGRLRRLGLPLRKPPAAPLDEGTIRAALEEHGSVRAAALTLGVDRRRFAAEAARLGLIAGIDVPADLVERYTAGATQYELAGVYGVHQSTVAGWLREAGVPARRRGRVPRNS